MLQIEDMETRLFRLAILVAVVSFLGFSGCALYYKYQYDSWIEMLANYPSYAKESFEHCGDMPTPAFVRTGHCPIQQDSIEQPADMPKRAMAKLRASAWAAGAVPASVLFVFYAGRAMLAAAARRKTRPATQRIAQQADTVAALVKTHAAIELIAMIENITPGAWNCVEQIEDVRRQIEVAADDGAITAAESRLLLKQTTRIGHGFDLDV